MVKIQVSQSPIYYRGGSMAHTFKPGDHLIIRPASLKGINPGDVIVFRTLFGSQVVHRVLFFREGGLITCGDHNPDSDLEIVTQDNLIGVVTGFERNGNSHPVLGGKLGLLQFSVIRLAIRICKLIKYFCHLPYSLVMQKNKRLIGRIWNPQIEHIKINLEHETMVKFLHRGRTVACWWPSRHYFECRKPYDLVIPSPEKNKQI